MLIHKMKRVQGEITVPGDKSISHRAVMLGALADGITHINGFLRGADCLSTIDCFRKMGVRIDDNGDSLTVYGNGLHGLRAPKVTLYTGNSGTTTRLLCGILAGQPFDAEITGDASICKRPMGRVTKPLSLMGADIENEYCPLIIHGTKLHGIDYSMTVASAQVKTAIILAGLYAEGETVIHEIEKSRDHTELMLGAMGADIAVDGLTIRVGKTDRLAPQDVTRSRRHILGGILHGPGLNHAGFGDHNKKCRAKPDKDRYHRCYEGNGCRYFRLQRAHRGR